MGWSVRGVGRSLLDAVERMLGGRLGLPEGGIIDACAEVDRAREFEWPLCADEGRGGLADLIEGDLYGIDEEDMFTGKGD